MGVSPDGTVAMGNKKGIEIFGSSNNRIGGTDPASRNVISGNNGTGIRMLFGTNSGNMVQNNYIGVDATGSLALPNTSGGIVIQSGAANNTIGGITTDARNVISGNFNIGITLTTGAHGNQVQGNYIGLDATGSTPLGTVPK